ncbi:hypothetical protein GY69_005225 [Salmonella enterica subsp. enterica]|uniref:Uncharacterized protein n=1 Tax=Salmonella enterica subsp. enterica serovar Kisarawe TaxID=2517242 RepID=A0A5X8YW78_SALET|nr:hypothetical protein [Salmonella enterica]EBH9884436.1 hypothetical protein [Salmonella enterica subsp. enterica serovar Kisarawe]EDS6474008.1 hypothetical protein [Salmonella enterica subsp. enterica]EHN2042187.1 hypothetical protein [Salmonella enterica subsp. enterica serovar Nima]EAT8301108.1 hypothetical protein [Salmonella enterica]
MDTETWIALVGVALTATGLVLPTIFSNISSTRTEYRKAAAPLLIKLNQEIDAISKGIYPFRSIKESELFQLYPFASKRLQKRLKIAYISYTKGRESARTKHWHDEHPDEIVFFRWGS